MPFDSILSMYRQCIQEHKTLSNPHNFCLHKVAKNDSSYAKIIKEEDLEPEVFHCYLHPQYCTWRKTK